MKTYKPVDLIGTVRCACGNKSLKRHMSYETKSNGLREMYRCPRCGVFFTETKNTPLEDIRTPISVIATVLRARDEGVGMRATARVFGVGRDSIERWESRFASMKDTLKLYLFCHEFIKLTLEGDEQYTKVGCNRPPDESEGWTATVMDRASRFILDQQCGVKDEHLFLSVMEEVAELARQTDELTFLSDGERRYGNVLFNLCFRTLRTGKRGRPPRTLLRGMRVRVKNKGSQSHKRGRKRPRYQKPWREHPETPPIDDEQIHAHHVEAHNASQRRKNSCYRRRSNTYAKITHCLQRTLDRHWIIHNFTQPHFTTGRVPAVALGIVDQRLPVEQVLTMQAVF